MLATESEGVNKKIHFLEKHSLAKNSFITPDSVLIPLRSLRFPVQHVFH